MPVSKKRKRKSGKRRAPRRPHIENRGASGPGPPADFRALEAVTAEMGRRMGGRERDERLEKAQDLVYKAWEVDGLARERMARKALGIHPDCADAFTILAEDSNSPEEAIPFYRQGVEAAERALGPDYFRDDAGHFWGVFETRPYMRARAGLAEALWATGAHENALVHFRDLLRLNESDNMGIRFVLLPRLLQLGRDEEAARLLDRFKEDATSQWAFGRALLTFRREGASERAELHLQEARKRNIQVEDYLTGLEPIPLILPDSVGFGDETEAMVCAAEQGEAWRASPGAIEWVREVAGLLAPAPAPDDIERRTKFLTDETFIASALAHPDMRSLLYAATIPSSTKRSSKISTRSTSGAPMSIPGFISPCMRSSLHRSWTTTRPRHGPRFSVCRLWGTRNTTSST